MLLIVTDNEYMFNELRKNDCSWARAILVEPKFSMSSDWIEDVSNSSVDRMAILADDVDFHRSLKRLERDIRWVVEDTSITLLDSDNAVAVRDAWASEMRQEPPLPDCVSNVCDVEKKDWSKIHGIQTGITEIDNLIGKMYDTQVSLIIGQAGQGKTTFADSIATHALHDGNEVFIYTGEMDEEDVRKDLENQSIAPSLLPYKGDLTPTEIESRRPYARYQNNNELVSAYMTERFSRNGCRAYVATQVSMALNTKDYFLEEVGNSALSLTRKMLECRPNIKLVILDNIMTAMDDLQEGDNEFVAQGKFMQQCCVIAKAYNVHICVICHVNKGATVKDVLDKYCVSGSSKITNLASLMLAFERGVDEKDEDCSYIGVVKNRVGGKETTASTRVRVRYNPINRNYMVWDDVQKTYVWAERMYRDINREIRDMIDRSVMYNG